MTPLQFSEQSLVGGLLRHPGRIDEVPPELEADDFSGVANGVLFRTIREMVAEARQRQPATAAWVMYHAEYRVGRLQAHLIPDSLEIFRVSRHEITAAELAQARERTELGSRLVVRQIEVSPAVSDDNLAYAAEQVLRDQPDFTFFTEALADDIIVGGVAYSADIYTYDGDGDVRELTPNERAERTALLQRAAEVSAARHYAVPGVNVRAVWERLQASNELGEANIHPVHLHNLMHNTPSSLDHRLRTYALHVAEASVRRTVQHAGMRVAQVSDTNPTLARLIEAIDTAQDHVSAVHQRWQAFTADRTVATTLAAGGGPADVPRVDPDSIVNGPSGLEVFADAPDEMTLLAAEESVLIRVATDAGTLRHLVNRLEPEDFLDPELANAYRAALNLYVQRGNPVVTIDMVTIAWEQQHLSERDGPGAPVERLLALQDQVPLGDLGYAVDVVMRGALARQTAHAAAVVQQAAERPGLLLEDVLHTTRTVYQAVRTTAERMTGRPSTASRMAGLDATSGPAPDDTPDLDRAREMAATMRHRAQPAMAGQAATPVSQQSAVDPLTGRGRTGAQVLDMRERAALLRARVTVPADTRPGDAPVSGLASRLGGDADARTGRAPQTTPAWPTTEELDPTTDYGPDR